MKVERRVQEQRGEIGEREEWEAAVNKRAPNESGKCTPREVCACVPLFMCVCAYASVWLYAGVLVQRTLLRLDAAYFEALARLR